MFMLVFICKKVSLHSSKTIFYRIRNEKTNRRRNMSNVGIFKLNQFTNEANLLFFDLLFSDVNGM